MPDLVHPEPPRRSRAVQRHRRRFRRPVRRGRCRRVVRPGGTASPTPAPSDPGPAIDELRRQVEALRSEQDRLTAQVRSAVTTGAETSGARAPVPTVSETQVAAAVERWFAARGEAIPAAPARGEDPVPFDVEAAYLDARTNSYWDNPEWWTRIHAAGKMDELIERFEQNAADNPRDPEAHMELGSAYLAYLQVDQTKWPLSMKADAEFDKVLALDEKHWAARFTKAVSYSFWPDFLGKKKGAITHFEVLADQQDSMPAEPEHAQTYVFLGNLLDQRGEKDRALEVWRRGLRRHPDNPELRGKTGTR
jgi:tetratricopeptide (TPR) repeat protein